MSLSLFITGNFHLSMIPRHCDLQKPTRKTRFKDGQRYESPKNSDRCKEKIQYKEVGGCTQASWRLYDKMRIAASIAQIDNH